MPFGLMAPPPLPQNEETPLSFAQGIGAMPPPDPTFTPDFAGGNIPSSQPDWAQQLMSSSSTPPQSTKPLEGGASLIQNTPQSKASKWLDTLAPILAGAAAVFGYNKDSAFGDVLMGVGQGYAQHLTDEAKAKRDLRAKSDTATVDLAHKYLSSMPGDVDQEKYPRLAEMGVKLREKLVNGQLSSPKEAQDFILEYTKYKEDLDKLEQDRKHTEDLAKASAPFEAFQGAFGGAGISPEATGSAMMSHYGGLVEDPQNPGHYIPPTVLSSREATSRASARDIAAGQRSQNEIASREKEGAANRAQRAQIEANREKGRTARAAGRTKKDTSQKDYDAAYAKASAHARALDAKRPISDPKQVQVDTYDYLLNSGHVVPIRGKNGQVGYYIGNGQVTTDRAKAEQIANAGRKMTPPPSISPSLDEEEEDSDIE